MSCARGGEVLVDECSFLVLNDGEPYSMEIDTRVPVRTCCVFFRRGFVEQVFRDVVCSDGRLLDGFEWSAGEIPFLSQLHFRDKRVMPRMLGIASSGEASSMWLDEQYLRLARDRVLLYEETQRQVRRLPAARAGTRLEIASATCLSTYHFQRMFSAAVGESPHSYLTKLRLNRARFLLAKGIPVTEVCGLVGFESPGSFSALFRRKFGVAPREISKIQKRRQGRLVIFEA